MRYLIIGTLFLVSCSQTAPKEVSAYFSLDSLLNHQTEILEKEKVSLVKKATASGDSAVTEFIPDSLGWANEFQLIRELDINKPALVGRYKKEVLDDMNSNLKVIHYSAKEDGLKVKEFKIYYLKHPSDIKIIEAKETESNSIFSSEKEVKLVFDDIDKKVTLTNFSIQGYQKMILQDSVLFKIEAKLKH